MSMRLACVIVALIGVVPTSADAQAYRGYSLSEVRDMRARFTERAMFEGGEVSRYVYLHMPEFYEHAVVDRAGPVRELPVSLRPDVAGHLLTTAEGRRPLDRFVQEATVDGLIVVHHGHVVFEAYPRMFAYEKHLGMSVSKVFVSTLIAILEHRREIDVGRPVTAFFPALAGSPWQNVAVIDLLDMTTGICDGGDDASCSDDFFAAAFGNAALDETLRVLARMKAHRPPGQVVEYSNVANTILAILLEEITGLPFSDLLEREIWQRMGASHDAFVQLTASGRAVALGGVSTTLRDLARFGLLFTPSERDEWPVVPKAHVGTIQRHGRAEIFAATTELDLEIFDVQPSADLLVDGERPRHSTYQWDVVMGDGDFYKGGYRGQGLYVSPGRDLVIAFFGHDTNAMPRMARQLAKSGLFDR